MRSRVYRIPPFMKAYVSDVGSKGSSEFCLFPLYLICTQLKISLSLVVGTSRQNIDMWKIRKSIIRGYLG